MQSTVFGPAKYGILPEILTDESLSRGNGYLGAFTFLAIVLGTAFGGILKPLSVNPLSHVFRTIKQQYGNKKLLRAIVGLVYFWFLAAVIQMTLLLFTKTGLRLDELRIGVLLGALAFSIGVGNILAGRLSERKVEIGLIPLGSLGLCAALLIFPLIDHSYALVICACCTAGVFSGFFVLPLNALVQAESPVEARGSILASVNFLSFAGILAASFVFYALSVTLQLSPAWIMFLLGLMTLGVSLYLVILLEACFVRFMLWMLTHSLYAIRIAGREHIPYHGPALLVCNHVSFVDALLVGAVVPRFIRFVMDRSMYALPVINHFVRLLHAIPIASGKRTMEALDRAAAELARGELVCIFPEG